MRRILLGRIGKIRDVGVGQPALFRSVDHLPGPFVKLHRVLVVATNAGDDQETRVLSRGAASEGAEQQQA